MPSMPFACSSSRTAKNGVHQYRPATWLGRLPAGSTVMFHHYCCCNNIHECVHHVYVTVTVFMLYRVYPCSRHRGHTGAGRGPSEQALASPAPFSQRVCLSEAPARPAEQDSQHQRSRGPHRAAAPDPPSLGLHSIAGVGAVAAPSHPWHRALLWGHRRP